MGPESEPGNTPHFRPISLKPRLTTIKRSQVNLSVALVYFEEEKLVI